MSRLHVHMSLEVPSIFQIFSRKFRKKHILEVFHMGTVYIQGHKYSGPSVSTGSASPQMEDRLLAILYRGLEYPRILVSREVLEPIPHGYCRMNVYLKLFFNTAMFCFIYLLHLYSKISIGNLFLTRI